MKKSNVILQAAIASALLVMVGSASAGTLSTAVAGGTLFASENFGPTSAATTDIVPGTVTYTVATTNGIVVNAAGKLYYTLRLTNGKFKAAPLAAQLTGTYVNVGAAGNVVAGVAVLSSDSTTAMWPLTFTATGTVGVGTTFIYTPPAIGTAEAIIGVNTALATAGGTVSGTGSMSAITPVVTAPSTTTSPNTGTVQAADIDGAATTAVIAKSAQAITVAVSALPTYTGKIDLTAIPVASDYIVGTTTPAAVKLGSATFTDTTDVETLLAGATTVYDITSAKTATSNTIEVTPGAGQAFPVGSVLSVSSAGDQCATRVGALAAFTTATSTVKATLTVPAANVLSGIAIEVCMTKPSTGNVAAPITASITAKMNGLAYATTTGVDTMTGTGYALGYNGSQVDVRNYVPAAATGFQNIMRVINTGSVTASVSVAKINETTGVVGASGVVAASVPAGGTVRLNQAAIEAVIGVVPTGERPRLRFTAPTNTMEVQNLMYSNGVYTSITQ